MFREHHEVGFVDTRGYAPNADPMNKLPPNAGAKRPPTGPFRAFLYSRFSRFSEVLEAGTKAEEGGPDMENDT